MSSHTKFELSSANLIGSATTNGQHGLCTSSLGRSSSFREGMENRLPSSLGTTKSISLSSQRNMGSIFQSLLADWKAMTIDQKLPRQGELKKILCGISRDDSSSAAISVKPLPSSVGELKRAKSTLLDSSNRARERAKYFCEAASQIDKHCTNSLLKKRARTDFLPNDWSDGSQPGVTMMKNRSHGHPSAGGTDTGNMRSEERARAAIPSRRIRTSMIDMRTERANVGVKPCAQNVGDKDRLKLVTCSASMSEEKAQALPPGCDWEKSKMKKKRSFIRSGASESVILAKPPAVDQEAKRVIQPRSGSDGQARSSSILGFRPSGCEYNNVASPAASLTKANASSRAPKSSATSSKASINIPQTLRGPDDAEIPQHTNKPDAALSANNHKRSITTRPPSPPMTQLLGQRLQKMSRATRRENLPSKSGQDDLPFSDSIDACTLSSEQNKLKNEFMFSDGLSESEEPSFAVKKDRPKHKVKRCRNLEEEDGHNLQRSRSLVFPSSNSKVADEDGQDLEDHTKIHQRHGRAAALLKSGMPNAIENLNRHASANQNRRASFGSEKIESKAGRPPTKKSWEWKGYARPRHANHNNSMDCSGDSIDDHKELLAAANYALHSRYACPNLFWKKFEPIFSLLSMEDTTFLKQQIQFVDEYLKVGYLGDGCYDGKVGLDSSPLPSTPALAGKADQRGLSDGLDFAEFEQMLALGGETENLDEPYIDHLVHTKGVHYGISICQALLSAMIEEDENKSFYCIGREEEFFDNDTCDIQLCIDADMKAKNLNLLSLDNSQTVKREYSNDYRINTHWSYYDELNNHTLENDDFKQMSLEDIIFLELNKIGLYPELVPDLAHCDEEGISESIARLKQKLNEKVTVKKNLLVKLEKVVAEAAQVPERELERIALDKLVEITYEKYTAVWGSNASGGENISKATKNAVHSFVKRTLARCKRFERTGRSCFNEPPFREMFDHGNIVTEHTHVIVDDHIRLKIEGGTRSNKLDKCLSDSFQSFNHLSENIVDEEKCSNKVKKRELFLNDVVGGSTNTSFKPHLGLENLVRGTKGKRSERDRDRKRSNKEATSRNGIGRPALSTVKGERKNKIKTKHKTTHSSASFNFCLGKTSNVTETVVDGDIKENDGSSLLPLISGKDDIVKDAEAIDFSTLKLPEIDVFGVASNEHDLGSWLNFEEDGLQDDDINGLEIPMDDLTDLNMMM